MSDRSIIKKIQSDIQQVARTVNFFKSDIRMLQEQIRHLESRLLEIEKDKKDDQ